MRSCFVINMFFILSVSFFLSIKKWKCTDQHSLNILTLTFSISKSTCKSSKILVVLLSPSSPLIGAASPLPSCRCLQTLLLHSSWPSSWPSFLFPLGVWVGLPSPSFFDVGVVLLHEGSRPRHKEERESTTTSKEEESSTTQKVTGVRMSVNISGMNMPPE